MKGAELPPPCGEGEQRTASPVRASNEVSRWHYQALSRTLCGSHTPDGGSVSDFRTLHTSRCGVQRREPLRRVADEVGQRTGCCARSPLSDGSLPAACTTTGAIPAPPVEGAGFGLTPTGSHGAPAAPSRFRYVVEHQPTARVGTLAEPAGIAAREQFRR